jgi:cellulose synthase/poly-beta-1,6-N-acetylglucosamine synthase-like glycosyltransferase
VVQLPPVLIPTVVRLPFAYSIYERQIDLYMNQITHQQINNSLMPPVNGGAGAMRRAVSLSAAPPLTDKELRAKVASYARWLEAQSQRGVRGCEPYRSEALREMNEYIENAGKTVRLAGRRGQEREIATFAPFRPDLSALKTFTPRQIIALIVLAIAWVAGVLVIHTGVLVGTIAFITLLYTSHLVLSVALALATFGRKNEEEVDERIVDALKYADWPHYTILCPLYKEAQIVPQFVNAMSALSYPTNKLQILLLTEQDDRETREAIRALDLPPHFQIVTVPDGKPRTKPRACNFGLMQATGQFVVIYDAEDIPEPLQLKKAVLTFANYGANLACVQAKLNYYNPEQNLLTRWFTAEYSLWFDLILPGLQRAKLSIPLGGTSNHFQIQTLRALGGWDAYNVTEDCDLGLRLARYRFDTVILNSVTYEEANSQPRNWIRQRSRWIKGYMQTYLVYMRHPWRFLRAGGWREFISLQLVIGGKTAVLFFNPLLWISFALYFLLRPELGDTFQVLYPKGLLYLSVISLVFGNFLYIYVYLLACIRRQHYKLVKYALFIPIYWMLMSVAALLALFQLIFKPHYWEKTIHGLHLRKNRPPPDIMALGSFAAPSLRSGLRLTRMTQDVDEAQTRRVSAYQNHRHPGRGPRPGTRLLPYTNNGDGTPTRGVATDWQARATPLASASKQEKEQTSVAVSVTAALRRLMTLPMPVATPSARAERRVPLVWWKNPWIFVLIVITANVSIAVCSMAFQHYDILLYSDAYSHLRIPLRVLETDFSTAQFGGVWLPLPHLLMVPFIWNSFLWRTGLAGSVPSMICYVVSAVFLFQSAYRLTKDNLASFVGTLMFALNPNVLYLQTTPLSELVCIATFTMACYYFLAWTQEDQPRYLVLAAGSTFLATMARYDGWMLVIVLPVLIVLVGRLKRHTFARIESNLIIFCLLGGLGIALWLVWCAVIFGDPLYFQHSQFSSQAQLVVFLQAHTLYTYHDIWQSLRYYALDSMDVVGPLLFILAALAAVIFIIKQRVKPEMLGALAFLVPFVFYAISLYNGQAIIYVPEAVPAHAGQHLFNTRYGAEMVAPAALFLATLVGRVRIPPLGNVWGKLGHVAFALVIIIQSMLIVSHGIITLQDGQHGVSCAEQHQINAYLAQHYNGGKILEDIYSSGIDGIDANIDYQNFINESSGQQWNASLQDPSKMDWIIVRPNTLRRPDDPYDLVAQHINIDGITFLTEFSLVVQEPTGLELYHRNGLAQLPTRPLPPGLLNEHQLCGASGS